MEATAVARILVVDDDPDILDLVRTRMSMLGHQVLTAGSGPAALASLDGRMTPDLVILDVSMPQMDGFELVDRLRELPDMAYLPVIFLSARVQDVDVERGLAMGARYLTKPFMGGALQRFVELSLQERTVVTEW